MNLDETLRTIVREEIRAALREVGGVQPAATELLTITQAAEVANVHRATVQRWLKAGQLQRRGSGRLTRVARSDVMEVLARGQVEAKPATAHDVARLIMRKAG